MLSNKEQELIRLATVGGLIVDEAYFQAYKPKTRRIASINLRRKQKMNPEIFTQIDRYKQDIFNIEKGKQIETISNSAIKVALTMMEKRAILRGIIEQTDDQEEIIVLGGEIKKVKRKANASERLRALDIDNKMAGDYAPIKVEDTTDDTKKMTDKELQEVLPNNIHLLAND